MVGLVPGVPGMNFLDRILGNVKVLNKSVDAPWAFTPHDKLLLGMTDPTGLRYAPGADPGRTSKFCAHCGSLLELGSDGGELVCTSCGIVSRSVACEGEEARTFSDEHFEERQAKKRAEEDTREASHDLCTFTSHDIPDAELRRLAANRLNKTLLFLSMLKGPGAPGEFFLNEDEARTFTLVVRMACQQWARESQPLPSKEAAPGDPVGSPIFWAIAIALGVVAKRECGFTVPTAEMVDKFTMVGIHARLQHYKGHRVTTSEKIGNRTVVGKASRVGPGSAATHRDGSRAIDDKSTRLARVESLGDAAARLVKLAGLNDLITNSGVWGPPGGDPYVIGLAKPVLEDRPPALVSPTHQISNPPPTPVTGTTTGLNSHRPCLLRGGARTDETRSCSASPLLEKESSATPPRGGARTDETRSCSASPLVPDEFECDTETPLTLARQKLPHIKPNQLKNATTQQVLGSSNYAHAPSGLGFLRHFHDLKKKDERDRAARVEKLAASERAKLTKAVAKQNKKQKIDDIRDFARESLAFNTLMHQAAQLEKIEKIGGCAVVPFETNGKVLPIIRVVRKPALEVKLRVHKSSKNVARNSAGK